MDNYIDSLLQLGALDALLYCNDVLAEMLQSCRACRRDFLAVIDLHGCIIQISPNSEATLGISPDEALGCNLWDLLQVETAEIRMRAINEAYSIVSIHFAQEPAFHIID